MAELGEVEGVAAAQVLLALAAVALQARQLARVVHDLAASSSCLYIETGTQVKASSRQSSMTRPGRASGG